MPPRDLVERSQFSRGKIHGYSYAKPEEDEAFPYTIGYYIGSMEHKIESLITAHQRSLTCSTPRKHRITVLPQALRPEDV